MRIAIVAPLHETVPPTHYGGTERIVYYLIEELVSLGHSVTLYAAGGSRTSATLFESSPISFRADQLGIDEQTPIVRQQFCQVLSDRSQFDVIHFHNDIDPSQIELFTEAGPYVWTDHGPVNVDNKAERYGKLFLQANIGLVAISKSQRSYEPKMPWIATIHHGIPINSCSARQDPHVLTPVPSPCQDYAAFLGRIVPEKGVDSAVRIAVSAGRKLKVAAKIDACFKDYYESDIRHLFKAHKVDFMGEIKESQKGAFLSGAVALIFPIKWNEPFGLVMIEAMACGTPVIAFDCGSVREVIDDGITGFIVKTEEEAIEKLKNIEKLDRALIRKTFHQRFSVNVMVENHLKVYKRIADGYQQSLRALPN